MGSPARRGDAVSGQLTGWMIDRTSWWWRTRREQRTFRDEQILQRLLFSSVNEACKILEEGKALRASDIDVMWLNGFGFPRYRGGLMFWADQIGAREVYNQIAIWHQRYGARWRPSRLLQELVESGGTLREVKGRMMK